jgi:hypothetical protein
MNMNCIPKNYSVKGTPTTETKRSLLAFSRTISYIPTDELIIEITRHEYTPEYTELTKFIWRCNQKVDTLILSTHLFLS